MRDVDASVGAQAAPFVFQEVASLAAPEVQYVSALVDVVAYEDGFDKIVCVSDSVSVCETALICRFVVIILAGIHGPKWSGSACTRRAWLP